MRILASEYSYKDYIFYLQINFAGKTSGLQHVATVP
ncbi:hypothetical protein predicted by Glimmer/Critica [Salmonella enterica subsp. enterica serovar Weltevreden str. 2007-60-3289-1]|nr:hypothetical protein predicted by Glimmer/Critica [Salmonella enterica subsp. enterica serovar Weltevreden str. 2007-60-3289-1]CFZ48365.1 Uncharacterised protein [Salmonella enterica subsp. enterica serovar Typhi]CGY25069.1 Uncharacterised protein [Salmonella enterica subsp. enterica serovar Typhi]